MRTVVRYLEFAWSVVVGLVSSLTKIRARRLRALDFAPFEQALAAVPPKRANEIHRLMERAALTEIQDYMDQGDLSAEELLLHCLARIRRLDGGLHCIIELNPEALSEAHASDERRRSDGAVGPLHGIPVTVKDNIATAGPMRTTAGSMLLADNVAHQDADVVAALRQAGAIILGKANLSEFAGAVVSTPGFSAVGGQTLNPYGERFAAGGSSSGSAVSVAAGLCPISIGTETSGSLVAPAAYNGVVGMKPSRGMIGGDGIVPLVRHQDSAGPIARSVADAAVLLSVIARSRLAVDLSPSALEGVAVGVLRKDILAQASPYEDTSDNEAMLDRVTDGLTRAGATTTDVTLVSDRSLSSFESGFGKVVLGGLTHDTCAYLASVDTPASSLDELHAWNLRRPRARIPRGQLILSLAYLSNIDRDTYERAALHGRALASTMLGATFAVGYEVLVSLSNRHSMLYATAGYPAITVPIGLRASGMPTGATFIGRAGSDAQLLAYAFAFEQATQLRVGPRVDQT